jgi:hypothetical protein
MLALEKIAIFEAQTGDSQRKDGESPQKDGAYAKGQTVWADVNYKDESAIPSETRLALLLRLRQSVLVLRNELMCMEARTCRSLYGATPRNGRFIEVVEKGPFAQERRQQEISHSASEIGGWREDSLRPHMVEHVTWKNAALKCGLSMIRSEHWDLYQLKSVKTTRPRDTDRDRQE